MPVVSLPNGDRIRFPDNMPKEEIHQWIVERFPTAPEHRDIVGQLARGLDQGAAGALLDISAMLPKTGILGGELPGLPEYARQARRQAMKETEKFANEPSEGDAQGLGRVVGGALPYMTAGPAGIVGGGLKAGMEATARATPTIARMGAHGLGHVLGVPPWLKWLTRAAADWAGNHPGVAAAGAKMAPGAGRLGEMVGNAIESRAVPLAYSTGRESYREPVKEPPREPAPKREFRQGRGDRFASEEQ